MVVALISIIAGIGLGIRYRAFVLIPATLVAWMMVAGLSVLLGAGFGLMAVGMLATGAALQFGFLVGLALRAIAIAGRGLARGRPASPVETPQVPAAP